MEAEPEVGMSFAHADGGSPTETEVRALMKVLIGVDPHKASVAVAAVDEAKGKLLERASFPQSHSGLRASDNPPGRPSLATSAPPVRTTPKTYRVAPTG